MYTNWYLMCSPENWIYTILQVPLYVVTIPFVDTKGDKDKDGRDQTQTAAVATVPTLQTAESLKDHEKVIIHLAMNAKEYILTISYFQAMMKDNHDLLILGNADG